MTGVPSGIATAVISSAVVSISTAVTTICGPVGFTTTSAVTTVSLIISSIATAMTGETSVSSVP